MEYPPNLADHVMASLARRYPSFHLPKQELESTLDACFEASISRDEGREVFFRALLAEPSQLGDVEPFRLEEFIAFTTPIPFSANSTIKLAQALGYADEIVVWQGAIQGIRRAAPAWWHLYNQLGMISPPSFFPAHNLRPAVTIRNAGPGQLHVSDPIGPLGALEAGNVFSPADGTCPIFEFFTKSDSDLHVRAEGMFQIPCSRLLLDVLARIARRRHGGSVLVVPSHGARDVPAGINPKYTAHRNALWQKLADVCDNAVQVAHMARTPIPGPATGQLRYQQTDNTPAFQAHKASLDQAIDAVEHEIRFLAGLSAVDGAIVLTDRFDLLGFGAELTVEEAVTDAVLSHDHDWSAEPRPRRMDEFGMRHRSMYKYILAHPTTTGFVVSQDGGIKGVQAINGAVHVWADLGS